MRVRAAEAKIAALEAVLAAATPSPPPRKPKPRPKQSESEMRVKAAEERIANLEAELAAKAEARVADLEAQLEATTKCDDVMRVEAAEIPAAGLKGPRKTKPPRPAGARSGGKVCFSFRERGWCKKGNSCEFPHVRVCKYYNADGGCWKGSKCEFAHESARATDTKPPLSTKSPTKPEDVIRAEAAEARLAALEAALQEPSPPETKTKTTLNTPSESDIRVDKAEARIAELEAKLKAKTPARAKKGVCSFHRGRGGCKNGDACDFVHQDDPETTSPTKSDSALRAEAAEERLAALEAVMMEISPPKTKSKKKTNTPSESVLRAEKAEARVAELEARFKSNTPVRAKKGVCSAYRDHGSCKNGTACEYLHQDDSALLKRKLAAKDRELEAVKQFGAIRSEMKVNIQKVEEEMKVKFAKANTLDLVIVMDCTGSMDPWIEAAKTSIIAIIQNVNVDHPNAKVRVGFVAYRDFCDGDKRLQVQPLTEEVDTVRDFISSLRAFGGGDGPEDIPGGLQKAIELDFQAEGKLIVLVADAPCHGSKFHDTRDDPIYKREILASPDICAQMRLIARKGIDFTFIEVKPKDTAKMVAILESEYQSVKSADESERDFVKVSLDKSGDV
ncbi:hypothetical protein BBJ28_00026489, partial [Nothophytophthora sp. Chile5]